MTPPKTPPVLVVMGVSGSGKSTVAAALVQKLGWAFVEGDDLHPPENIAKMRSGQPLDDDDRAPWLARIADWIAVREHAGEGGIVTCSALKSAYREILTRHGSGAIFVYLKIAPELAEARARSRRGHFMPAALVSSQFDALEEPAEEDDVILVEAARPVEIIVADIVGRLRGLGVSLPA